MNAENRYQPPKADVADVAGDVEELASRWARLGGAILDGLILAAIMFPLMFATGYWERTMAAAMSGGNPNFGDQLQMAGLGLVLQLLLNGYLLTKYGQTIGKRIAGTRIVSVADNTVLPLWRVFVMRILPISVGSQVPAVGPVLGLVNVLFIFRSDKRCVHDLIAGTKVIRATAEWHSYPEGSR